MQRKKPEDLNFALVFTFTIIPGGATSLFVLPSNVFVLNFDPYYFDCKVHVLSITEKRLMYRTT